MILRRRGETHKQFINRLQDSNNRLLNEMSKKDKMIDNLVKEYEIVPKSAYDELLEQHNKLRNDLIRYGLYTGK